MNGVAKSGRIRLRRDGLLIVMESPKDPLLHYEAAREFARALLRLANEAEAEDNLERTVQDSAIFRRAGVPFSMSTDPRINEMAKRDSQWDKKVRQMPVGMMPIKSTEVVYPPRVIQHEPKKQV